MKAGAGSDSGASVPFIFNHVRIMRLSSESNPISVVFGGGISSELFLFN